MLKFRCPITIPLRVIATCPPQLVCPPKQPASTPMIPPGETKPIRPMNATWDCVTFGLVVNVWSAPVAVPPPFFATIR